MLTIVLQFVALPLWTLFLLLILACIVQVTFDRMVKSHYSAKLAYEKAIREAMFGAWQPQEEKSNISEFTR